MTILAKIGLRNKHIYEQSISIHQMHYDYDYYTLKEE